MKLRSLIAYSCFLQLLLILSTAAEAHFKQRFDKKVKPFLETYCLSCHDHEKPKGDFDLSPYSSIERVVQDHQQWEMVLEKLQAGEMPPSKAKAHPSSEARKEIVDWIQSLNRFEAQRRAGDPGPVLPRRLSNAEYDYSIRDLTGVELHPTKEFPVDPANQAGFDNSGESLAMSPALLKKYLQAARDVAEHLYLTPETFAFSPHSMMADTDRDKFCVLRIVDFYKHQPTDLADYFMAAWKYKHRFRLGTPKLTLEAAADQTGISRKYLPVIWGALSDSKDEVGPMGKVHRMFTALPDPKGGKVPPDLRKACEGMRETITSLRDQLVPEVKNLSVDGMNGGSQTLVMWKNNQMAANRRRYDPKALHIEGDIAELMPTSDRMTKTNMANNNRRSSTNRPNDTPDIVRKGGFFLPPKILTTNSSATFKMAAAKGRHADPDLIVPRDPGLRARYEASFAKFASIFPDAFYISERGRVYLDPEKEKENAGRLLSAGFHSMTGYFRDDQPLYDLILDQKGQRELDRLWEEFYFIASVPQRMHTSFIWFERTDSRFMIDAQFDFARAEDKDSTSAAKVKQLHQVYADKARRNGAREVEMEAINDHFQRVLRNIQHTDTLRANAVSKHLTALQDFARKAYRRPLTTVERVELTAFYQTLVKQDGLTHEDALRDTIVSILVSPHFWYRLDLADFAHTTLPANLSRKLSAQPASLRVRPLSDYALASRLSYFLWSSLPDEELLKHAAAGHLHEPKVLLAQVRRMLESPNTRALALEFAGNWLDIRRFEELNSVDRERFPQFNNELREAMFEEPIHFFLDVVQENRSVLDFLYSKATYVNPVLARHYGMPEAVDRSWTRVENANDFGRGGLLPMAAFLTKNAPGLRTSPVKRGYWVVRRLLGERIPPPPATVPELPSDESKLGGLTLRETLSKHREDSTCASCHAKFDSFGLVFEGYGPVGERRQLDLGGRPVDVSAGFPNGQKASGLEGLRQYIREQREAEFVDNLCRKLLAYALGRTLILSDDMLIQEMRTKLRRGGNRFQSLVDAIVTSPQFMYTRSRETVAQN